MPTPRAVSVALLQTTRLGKPKPAYWSWLNASETARAHGFTQAREARDYVAAHALLRGWLSHLAEGQGLAVPPARWRFSAGKRGKPHVTHGPRGADFRFSLSHSEGVVAVAIAVGGEVGIDVERESRQIVDPLRIARVRFSAAQLAELAALEDLAARRRRFMAIWTQMEALAKGTGLGLGMRRDTRLLPGAGAAPEAPAADPERRTGWQFAQWRFADHLVALAAEQPAPGEALRIRCTRVVWNASRGCFEAALTGGNLHPIPA